MDLTKDQKRLRDLEYALADLGEDAMLPSEFDGFAAGLIVCPEAIPPSDWLPSVWGANGDGAGPDCSREVFDDAFAVIMAHYNTVAATLLKRPEKYAAVCSFDEDDEPIWEFWAEGFGMAIGLRPQAWEPVLQDEDSEGCAGLTQLATLVAIAQERAEELGLDEDGEAARVLSEAAPAIIPLAVQALHAWRLAHPRDAAPTAPSAPKAGRNDPCPCGSGKKYKKCCGAS